MKICLSCSSGGHLDELLGLKDAFIGHDVVFTLPYNQITKNLTRDFEVVFFHAPPKPHKHFEKIYFFQLLFYYVYLMFVSLKIILVEKPNMIIGNGGEATLGLSYIGKLLDINIVYIESLARIDNLSGTGRLVYPLCDLFLVQWESLLLRYPRAEYWGKVI